MVNISSVLECMMNRPLSPAISLFLSSLSIILLVYALSISYRGFVGWGDVIAVILILGELVLVLLNLLFLSRALQVRDPRFNRFSLVLLFFLPLLMLVILLVMASHQVSSWIFAALSMGGNLLPLLIYIRSVNSQ